MIRCSQILREERLPPLPEEPKLNTGPKFGLKEMHELLQTIREECQATSQRHEVLLNRLLENQQPVLDPVVGPDTRGSGDLPDSAFLEGAVEQQEPLEKSPKPVTPREPPAKEEEVRGSGKVTAEPSTGAEDDDDHVLASSSSSQVIVLHDGTCRGKIRAIMSSRKFDGVMGVLICLNVLMMFIELEKTGYQAAVELKLREDTGAWDSTGGPFQAIEDFFNIVFFLELTLRFVVDCYDSVRSIAVWFDAFIVLTSFVDYFFKFVMSGSGGANVNFLRMARLIKLVKLFRAFKAAAVFSELRILIKTLLTSMMALTWSVVLLSFIMLFSGLVMAQLTTGFIHDEGQELEIRTWVFEHYGSGSRAVYTLFEATLSGGWPNYARNLIENVSFYYAFFWILYVLIVVFAVMRVVSALFLQNTLKMANADDELMHMDKMKKKEAYIAKLKDFLASADKDGNGNMDQRELKQVLHRPDIQQWLDIIGLESHEVMGLFHVLDDGHGEITHVELLNGMMKLSNGVRAIDSVLLQRDMGRLLKAADQLCGKFGLPAWRVPVASA